MKCSRFLSSGLGFMWVKLKRRIFVLVKNYDDLKFKFLRGYI